ncbi:MAG TPA: hypothetical protein VL361_09620 [Candidatus Limnocylindrales bacterium]|nr:hypothetical protein [Candidatus Limnocylindrales bacterium]
MVSKFCLEILCLARFPGPEVNGVVKVATNLMEKGTAALESTAC